ncbi:sugar phosphate isomerase/epimerase family protein [Cupriavidus basilensis]
MPEKLEKAAAAGFDGVEIFENDLLNFDGSWPMQCRIWPTGLDIPLYQPFRDFEAMPDEFRTRNMERRQRKFDVMESLARRMVLVCAMQGIAVDDPARAAADLRAMAEAARSAGSSGLEALSGPPATRLWRQVWDIVRQADHPALGLIPG